MPPRTQRPIKCQICQSNESKYTCSQCFVVYCSVACFKQHKEQSTCLRNNTERHPTTDDGKREVQIADSHAAKHEDQVPLVEDKPLRPLTSLRWPYVPEESSYPDPLKRDDPKTLQLSQYEAIATSPSIRNILSTHENLPALLTSIDRLRGPAREEALQRALGLTAPDIDDQLSHNELSGDVLSLRKLAEAVEAAVRGGNESALGLDWEQ